MPTRGAEALVRRLRERMGAGKRRAKAQLSLWGAKTAKAAKAVAKHPATAAMKRKSLVRVTRLRQKSRLPAVERMGRFFYRFGMVVVILSLISSFATYFILTNLTPIRPTNEVVSLLLLVSIVLLLILLVLVAWQVAVLWRAHRNRQAGARLHVRIVTLFSLIATVPAVLLAIFASVHIDGILDKLFSNQIQTIINQSVRVAHSYLEDHRQGVKNDVLAIAKELDSAARLARKDPEQFRKLLNFQASLHGVSQAYLIDRRGRVLLASENRLNKPYFPPEDRDFAIADQGGVALASLLQGQKVVALKKLSNFKETYLYVLRSVNPVVLGHVKRAKAHVAQYQRLKGARGRVQVVLALMYVSIALSLLLSAVWLGLWFANRLVEPIRRLITASQKVSQGNFDVVVNVKERHGDIATLAETFTKMTSELKSQRNELVEANTQLDERRRFIEAVLYGVTAGVIGIDNDQRITLANRSTRKLLKLSEKQLLGAELKDVIPDFAPLLAKARAHPKGRAEGQISMILGTSERNFAVRVTRESSESQIDGYVITFDDITELVTAQRTSAWADVARRIAHEIKNPLTPIQLSAERIRRKYGKLIEADKETFEKLTETIIRHVGDIKRMVDEFSAFARMPKPEMQLHDVRNIVRDAVLLFQVSHPEIHFDVMLPDQPVMSLCDRRLITQAVTNLVKNASEAIEAAALQAGQDQTAGYQGRIIVRMTAEHDSYQIDVIDNGIGLPKESRNRLFEPYVTTREKGTGLGLAIVKKITEQHRGQITLRDISAAICKDIEQPPERGACVRMRLPVLTEAIAEEAENAENNGAGENEDDAASNSVNSAHDEQDSVLKKQPEIAE